MAQKMIKESETERARPQGASCDLGGWLRGLGQALSCGFGVMGDPYLGLGLGMRGNSKSFEGQNALKRAEWRMEW